MDVPPGKVRITDEDFPGNLIKAMINQMEESWQLTLARNPQTDPNKLFREHVFTLFSTMRLNQVPIEKMDEFIKSVLKHYRGAQH